MNAKLCLLLSLFILLLVAPSAHAQATDALALQASLEDVTSATAYRYDSKDDTYYNLETLKVIDCGCGSTAKYIGVYHNVQNGQFVTHAATSDDLINWELLTDLDTNASQPTIKRLADGSYLLAVEAHSPSNHVRLRHFDSFADLAANDEDASLNIDQALSVYAEGTPDIRSVVFDNPSNPDIYNSQITLGFHYYNNGDTDKQAMGTLEDFDDANWSSWSLSGINTIFDNLGLQGNYGDRDSFYYNNRQFIIYEGQYTKNDWGSWRTFLYDVDNDQMLALDMNPHYGQTAFGNATVSVVADPDGTGQVLFSSAFLFGEGAPNGAGQMLYYFSL